MIPHGTVSCDGHSTKWKAMGVCGRSASTNLGLSLMPCIYADNSQGGMVGECGNAQQ